MAGRVTQQPRRVAIKADAIARVTLQAERVAVVPDSTIARVTLQSLRVAVASPVLTGHRFDVAWIE